MNLLQYADEIEKLHEKIEALSAELADALGDLDDLNEWFENHGVVDE